MYCVLGEWNPRKMKEKLSKDEPGSREKRKWHFQNAKAACFQKDHNTSVLVEPIGGALCQIQINCRFLSNTPSMKIVPKILFWREY